MASYASIVRRPKTEKKPSIGTLLHNQRITLPKNLLPERYRLPNYHFSKISNATKTFREWELENDTRYAKINGRKLRSDAHRLESLVIVLSGEQVATQNPDDIWKKAKEFKVWFEKKYRTNVRTMDWHRDEGHVDVENFKAIFNDHIHLEFDNVNEDGKMVRKLFSKGDLIAFQDKIAEIYQPLGFIRGEKAAFPKRGIPQKEFSKIQKTKSLVRKNTKESYKAIVAEREAREARAKVSEVKAEIAKLKDQLKERKAKRPQYAELEQMNRDLQQRVRDRDLTIRQMSEELKKFEDAMSETYDIDFENMTLKSEIKKVKVNLQDAKVENQALKSENSTLKAELSTLPSQNTTSELKSLKSDFEHKLEQKNEHIKKLEDGYKKICKSIGIDVDKIEIKDIDLIVKTVDAMTTIINNVSKYIGIAEDKLIRLFSGGKLPKSHEVEAEREAKREDIVLPKSKSHGIFGGIKFKR